MFPGQMGYVIPPASCGSAPGSSLSARCAFKGRWPRGILCRYLNHLRWCLSLTVKKHSLYFQVRAPQPPCACMSRSGFGCRLRIVKLRIEIFAFWLSSSSPQHSHTTSALLLMLHRSICQQPRTRMKHFEFVSLVKDLVTPLDASAFLSLPPATRKESVLKITGCMKHLAPE